jgi:hypothetical protein
MLHDRAAGTIHGWITEPSTTFGNRAGPTLHATFRGTYDPQRRRLAWIKTYDGTNQVTHTVAYAGDLAADGQRITGTWTTDISGDFDISPDRTAWDAEKEVDSVKKIDSVK